MTERFTIENDIEMKDNWNINKRCYHFGNGFDAKDCCNMLNELQDENKELKKENAQFDILIKNNQLAYIDLEKENEHIKHTIKTMMENERTELGRSVLKQLWEAIQ